VERFKPELDIERFYAIRDGSPPLLYEVVADDLLGYGNSVCRFGPRCARAKVSPEIKLGKSVEVNAGVGRFVIDANEQAKAVCGDRTFSGNESALSRYANCVDYRRVTAT
jgi:hypothetical protein